MKYYIRLTSEKGNIEAEGGAILYDINTSEEIAEVIKSCASKVAMEFLQRLGMGRIDKTIRLNLLGDGQKECVVREYKENPEKFHGFNIIE